MILNNISEIELKKEVETVSITEDDSPIYELARAELVFSPNEIAKLEIAVELYLQGISIEAISRMLSIPQEELFAELDS